MEFDQDCDSGANKVSEKETSEVMPIFHISAKDKSDSSSSQSTSYICSQSDPDSEEFELFELVPCILEWNDSSQNEPDPSEPMSSSEQPVEDIKPEVVFSCPHCKCIIKKLF